jgi:hypothetical protein
LPLFDLDPPLSTSLEIGIEGPRSADQNWSGEGTEIRLLVDATSLRGMVKAFTFECEFDPHSSLVHARGSGTWAMNQALGPFGSLLGTIGGILYHDHQNRYLALTCCYVIPDTPY